MKPRWFFAALAAGLVLAAGPLRAQSLAVSYMEGSAAHRASASEPWTALSIGDTVSLEGSVKLEKLALVQLKAPGSAAGSITFTQPGTYSIRTVLAASSSLRSAGAVQAAAIAFSRVLKGSGRRVDAVGGVRSEVMPPQDYQGLMETGPSAFDDPASSTLADESPAQRGIRAALDLIASGDYPGAISRLWDVLPSASGDEAREARFYLASAHELAGDTRSALAALEAASPKSGDPWALDSILLGARLLEDTFAWAQARDLLVSARWMFADDGERGPTYFFLLAVACQGTGEKELRDDAAGRVFSLDPSSDLAVAASRLRAMP